MIRVIRVFGTCVVVLVLVGVAGALAESTGSESPRKLIGPNAKADRSRDYVGTLVGYGEKNVRFELPSQGGPNTKIRFKAEGVGLVCEDNSFPEIDIPAIRLPLVSRTVFQGQRYRRRPNGDWSYYEVKGRLLGPRRAIGYLYYVEEPFDPPGSENRPECSTGGQLYLTWKARRVR